MSRLTRKEIKRDEILETVGSVFEYTRSHSRMLLFIGVGVLLAAVAVAGAFSWSKGRVVHANESLAEALRALAPAEGAPEAAADPLADPARRAAAREAFEAVVEGFPRSGAAVVARSYLADIAAREGNPEAARALWEEALRRAGEHLLAAQIEVNLLELARQQGRAEEAAERLRAMLAAGDARLPEDLIHFQLGLSLERLERPEEARESYLRVAEDHPDSALAPRARDRAERLAG